MLSPPPFIKKKSLRMKTTYLSLTTEPGSAGTILRSIWEAKSSRIPSAKRRSKERTSTSVTVIFYACYQVMRANVTHVYGNFRELVCRKFCSLFLTVHFHVRLLRRHQDFVEKPPRSPQTFVGTPHVASDHILGFRGKLRLRCKRLPFFPSTRAQSHRWHRV